MRYYFFLYLFGFSLTVSMYAQKTDPWTVIPPFQQMPERTPHFPLKTNSLIYNDSLVALAKENIQRYPWAKAIRDKIIREADKMLNYTEEELTVLMADARVPRAFELCVKGCPVHGDAVFKWGPYPWIVDLKHPFQVRCPIDGQVFPSNDYADYYNSGFEHHIDRNVEYADDGWGWQSPEGERYWFVAYANHWTWYNHIIPGILNLARAYLLTGDNRYAAKAAFMLYRMASVYPSMNHQEQSRMGLYMKSQGQSYTGKIVNYVWETYINDWVAEAYDVVWKTIDTDMSLQKRTGKTGEELRAFIEANLLEDGIEGFEQGKMDGNYAKIEANYGITQGAMITVQLSRQYAGMEQSIRAMFNNPSPHPLRNGLKYGLYNQIFRDGINWEVPGYNAVCNIGLMQLQERLPAEYKSLLTTFRFRQLYDAFLDIVAIGKYTPDIGDSGTVLGGLIALSSDTYRQAYDVYHEPRYLPWIRQASEKDGATVKPASEKDDATVKPANEKDTATVKPANDDKGVTSFRSLFHRPVPDTPALQDDRAVDVQPSRLFAGYGLGILNDKADKTAVSFIYGRHYAHDHWDYLNIEVFANGQKMIPDFGYPDAMNVLVPEVYAWSKNSVSHNTVMVDLKCQERKLPGTLHDFVDGGFARTMDASSPAYGNTSEYRRNVIMVDAEDGQSYMVDFFNVCGGARHDFIIHGPPGKSYCTDDEWSDVTPEGFVSPSPYFFNVRQLKNGKGILACRHVRDEDARLRIFPLSTSPDYEIFMADAYDKPRAKDNIIKYLIYSNKTGTDTPLNSMFVSVLELYKGERQIIAETRLASPDQGSGHVVVVERGNLTDVIIYDPSGSTKKLNRQNLQTDAVSTVVTFDKSGKLTRAFFSCGSYLHCQGKKFTAEPVTGKVVSVDALARTFRVEMEGNGKISEKGLEKRIAHFTNDFRTTVHPLSTVNISGKQLDIKVKDDVLIGYFRAQKFDGNRLTPDNNFMPFYATYTGATILDKDYRPLGVVADLNEGMRIKGPVTLPFQAGDEAWVCNIGSGDRFLIKPVFSWEK